MNSAAIKSEQLRVIKVESERCINCRKDFNRRVHFWRTLTLSAIIGFVVFTCVGCGPLPDFEVCGAPVTNCPNLTPQASQAAFDAVGTELAARGMIPNANICQFGYELAIDCEDRLEGDVYGRYFMRTQDIKILKILDPCTSVRVLSHELIHWAAHRLLGVWTDEHEEPFFGYPSATSVEAHAFLPLANEYCAERSEAPN